MSKTQLQEITKTDAVSTFHNGQTVIAIHKENKSQLTFGHSYAFETNSTINQLSKLSDTHTFHIDSTNTYSDWKYKWDLKELLYFLSAVLLLVLAFTSFINLIDSSSLFSNSTLFFTTVLSGYSSFYSFSSLFSISLAKQTDFTNKFQL